MSKTPLSRDLGFIHRFEPGTDSDTVLVLHGTGGDESDLLPLARDLAPGANLLSPRGQVLEHGMNRFFRRLDMNVFDEADLSRRAGDLAQFVRAASAHYGFDPARLTAFGYSNGANMAAALLLLDGELLRGAALLRVRLPLSPPGLPDLSGKPVLISAGIADPYQTRSDVDELSSLLQRSGADVEVRWQDAGHELSASDLATVAEWFRRVRT